MRGRELTRAPGTAVFPHPSKGTTPLALRAKVEFNHVLHGHVVIVSVRAENVPNVPPDRRILSTSSSTPATHLHLEARFGFQDEQDLPDALRRARNASDELDIDLETASYSLSRLTIGSGNTTGLMRWRKRLFIGLAHNAANPQQPPSACPTSARS